jgi:preprotein translocase subunit SecA
MFAALVRKVFGSANDRLVKKFSKLVPQINAFEPEIQKLSDDELRAQTEKFRSRLSQGESLESLIPEAFATVREAAKRVLGQRHYDVQLIGGLVLNSGMIAEMKTGEGKTLVGTLPVYLNALPGKGVHVVTVNDYLAQRDANWMGAIYQFLGLSVGCILHGLNDVQRRQAYNCDITYGTNHEFGFDYLRDNMKFRLSDMVMRPFNYAIVDEVDSILIDEARTPLIISGPAEDSSELYTAVDVLIPLLEEGDFEKDEKQKNVTLTENGVERIENELFQRNIIKGNGLYDIQNMAVVHHVNAALKAHKLFARDVDYIVKNDEIIIIDEFTGRMMEGRRYSDGLHQAIEAKEKVTIQTENQTLASITYQNYFRLYPKLGGMAGTAGTEASEFEEIYNLRVVEVPTHVPVQRNDMDDDIFLTAKEKYGAVLTLVRECHERGQPVLVGTTSIEKNEFLAELLRKEKIPHQVLNARHHDQEAYIVANAGRTGAVTVATNMAGRGTDIKLGGSWEARVATELKHLIPGPEREKEIERIKAEVAEDQAKVLQSGGLFVIGTERHESRRIDNQLRGRSGRQGDPGASKFFISLEDDLMRIFGSNRMDAMLRRLGVQEGEAISHSWISKAIERAQQKVEARNFDIRKHLLKYDDVMNDQRKIIYEQRKELMRADSIADMIESIREDVMDHIIESHVGETLHPDQWDIQGLHAECNRILALNLPIEEWMSEEGLNTSEIKARIEEAALNLYGEKEAKYGAEVMRSAEKNLVLRIMDQSWKDHLLALDHLRQGINLRAYAQSNPLNEYKREAFNMFQSMLLNLRVEAISVLSHFSFMVSDGQNLESLLIPEVDFDEFDESTPGWSEDLGNAEEKEDKITPIVTRKATEIDTQDPSTWGRVQRNALCPCGSGKKYKHCHGSLK